MKPLPTVFTCLLMLSIFLTSCNRNKSAQPLDKQTFHLLQTACPAAGDTDLIVYYMDGDCSMCLARMKFMDRTLTREKNDKVLFIAKTLNPEIFKYNLQSIPLKSCLYIDTIKRFDNLLAISKIINVHKDGTAEPFDLKE